MNPIEIVRMLVLLGCGGLVVICCIAWLAMSVLKKPSSTTPQAGSQSSPPATPIAPFDLPDWIRNAAAPPPKQPPIKAEPVQSAANALRVFQEFGDTLIALGVSQDEVSAILEPHAKLLLKKGGK